MAVIAIVGGGIAGDEAARAARKLEPDARVILITEQQEPLYSACVLADYVAGVAEGPTTGVSERRSLAIVQAGYESAQSGQAVNLTERFGDL